MEDGASASRDGVEANESMRHKLSLETGKRVTRCDRKKEMGQKNTLFLC